MATLLLVSALVVMAVGSVGAAVSYWAWVRLQHELEHLVSTMTFSKADNLPSGHID